MGGLAWLIDTFSPTIGGFRVAGVSPNEAKTYLSLSAMSVGVLDPKMHSYLKNDDLLQ